MDLGATSYIAETGQLKRLEKRVAKVNKKWGGYADGEQNEREPQNFLINVRGCSTTVYPVLAPFDDLFQKLFEHVLSHPLASTLQIMENQMMEALCPMEGLTAERQKQKVDALKDLQSTERAEQKKRLAQRNESSQATKGSGALMAKSSGGDSAFPGLGSLGEALDNDK